MKPITLGPLRLPASHWRTRARHLMHTVRSSADASQRSEPTGYSFDDSRHPLWAIANGIAIFFLVMCMVSFFVLMVGVFWTPA